MAPEVHLVDVFPAGRGGGNPAPIVLDAAGMTDDEMRAVARGYGHESGFVLPAPPGSNCDFALRFWVPNHEMSMCGHASVAAVWLLDRYGLATGDTALLHTASGVVHARITRSRGDCAVEISQPPADIAAVPDHLLSAVLDTLRITPAELAPFPVLNASTSRIKTLVPVASPAALDALQPDFSRMKQVCDQLDSTGLYPCALSDPERQIFDARQFPRSSGYPEDAATGIAAAALAFGLLSCELVEPTDRPIRVRQGRAMGRPSEITLRFETVGGQVNGLWLGGAVEFRAAT